MTDMGYYIKLRESGRFNDDQLEEIHNGIKYGLTKDEISVYAHSKFTAEQMRELRIGFEMGLFVDQVQSYANQYYFPYIMADARYKILHNM